jgi:hypothetical protein
LARNASSYPDEVVPPRSGIVRRVAQDVVQVFQVQEVAQISLVRVMGVGHNASSAPLGLDLKSVEIGAASRSEAGDALLVKGVVCGWL